MSSNINIDFEICDYSRNTKIFIILDISNWAHIYNKPSIIEIIPPGEKKPSVLYLRQNVVNIITAKDMNMDCMECGDSEMDIPDGIYDITIKGSPDKFFKNKKYLRTTKTRLELDKLFIDFSKKYHESTEDTIEKIKKLNEIKLLLESAEANVRYNNNFKAQELMNEIQKIIKKYKNCK